MFNFDISNDNDYFLVDNVESSHPLYFYVLGLMCDGIIQRLMLLYALIKRKMNGVEIYENNMR